MSWEGENEHVDDKIAFLLGSALRNCDTDQFTNIYDTLLPDNLTAKQLIWVKEKARAIEALPEDEFNDLAFRATDFSLVAHNSRMSSDKGTATEDTYIPYIDEDQSSEDDDDVVTNTYTADVSSWTPGGILASSRRSYETKSKSKASDNVFLKHPRDDDSDNSDCGRPGAIPYMPLHNEPSSPTTSTFIRNAPYDEAIEMDSDASSHESPRLQSECASFVTSTRYQPDNDSDDHNSVELQTVSRYGSFNRKTRDRVDNDNVQKYRSSDHPSDALRNCINVSDDDSNTDTYRKKQHFFLNRSSAEVDSPIQTDLFRKAEYTKAPQTSKDVKIEKRITSIDQKDSCTDENSPLLKSNQPSSKVETSAPTRFIGLQDENGNSVEELVKQERLRMKNTGEYDDSPFSHLFSSSLTAGDSNGGLKTEGTKRVLRTQEKRKKKRVKESKQIVDVETLPGYIGNKDINDILLELNEGNAGADNKLKNEKHNRKVRDKKKNKNNETNIVKSQTKDVSEVKPLDGKQVTKTNKKNKCNSYVPLEEVRVVRSEDIMSNDDCNQGRTLHSGNSVESNDNDVFYDARSNGSDTVPDPPQPSPSLSVSTNTKNSAKNGKTDMVKITAKSDADKMDVDRRNCKMDADNKSSKNDVDNKNYKSDILKSDAKIDSVKPKPKSDNDKVVVDFVKLSDHKPIHKSESFDGKLLDRNKNDGIIKEPCTKVNSVPDKITNNKASRLKSKATSSLDGSNMTSNKSSIANNKTNTIKKNENKPNEVSQTVVSDKNVTNEKDNLTGNNSNGSLKTKTIPAKNNVNIKKVTNDVKDSIVTKGDKTSKIEPNKTNITDLQTVKTAKQTKESNTSVTVNNINNKTVIDNTTKNYAEKPSRKSDEVRSCISLDDYIDIHDTRDIDDIVKVDSDSEFTVYSKKKKRIPPPPREVVPSIPDRRPRYTRPKYVVRSVTPPPRPRVVKTKEQSSRSHDLSPSSFPALSNAGSLEHESRVRRNSVGDVPTAENYHGCCDDSDIESVKSLPVTQTRVDMILSPPSSVMSYARITASTKTSSRSTADSIPAVKSASIEQPVRPAVWKGVAGERRHSIGSHVDMLENEKEGVSALLKSGSQDLQGVEIVPDERALIVAQKLEEKLNQKNTTDSYPTVDNYPIEPELPDNTIWQGGTTKAAISPGGHYSVQRSNVGELTNVELQSRSLTGDMTKSASSIPERSNKPSKYHNVFGSSRKGNCPVVFINKRSPEPPCMDITFGFDLNMMDSLDEITLDNAKISPDCHAKPKLRRSVSSDGSQKMSTIHDITKVPPINGLVHPKKTTQKSPPIKICDQAKTNNILSTQTVGSFDPANSNHTPTKSVNNPNSLEVSPKLTICKQTSTTNIPENIYEINDAVNVNNSTAESTHSNDNCISIVCNHDHTPIDISFESGEVSVINVNDSRAVSHPANTNLSIEVPNCSQVIESNNVISPTDPTTSVPNPITPSQDLNRSFSDPSQPSPPDLARSLPNPHSYINVTYGSESTTKYRVEDPLPNMYNIHEVVRFLQQEWKKTMNSQTSDPKVVIYSAES